MTDINLDPDAPWTPDRAREVAARFAEEARLLNYASHPGCDALSHPVDLASVTGDVSVALTRLIQFFAQTGHIIGEHADAWEPDGMAAEATADSARAWADDARTECAPLSEIAGTLHQRLSHLRLKETPDA